MLKKINAFLTELSALTFLSEKERRWLEDAHKKPFTPQEVDAAIAFIRTLDPYPARNFSSAQTQFVAPDVYVEKLPLADEDEKSGIVSPPQESAGAAHCFRLTLAHGAVPSIAVSKDFLALAEKSPADAAGKDARKFASEKVRDARAFIESVQFRESTVMRAAAEIVRAQFAFFEHGPRSLAPLRQKDIAARLGVHEATISRMAKGKYLQCEWGLFEFGYFFTNAVASDATAAQPADAPAPSKEAVKYEIAEILQAHSGDKKQLSDQKLADLLAEKGIRIARRTVAKYRAELNINSSYSR